MIDIRPDAPRIVTLRDDAEINLGFAVRVKEVITLQEAKIDGGYCYTSRGIRDVEKFRSVELGPCIAWLDAEHNRRLQQ